MFGRHSTRRRLTAERLEFRQLLAGDISLVKDVNTLPNPYPVIDAVSGEKVLRDLEYFINQDPVTGRELWRTDGTPSGTFILKDIA